MFSQARFVYILIVLTVNTPQNSAENVCNADALVSSGRWVFLDETVRSDPSYCPQTFLQMLDSKHSVNYICRGSHAPYRKAYYVQRGRISLRRVFQPAHVTIKKITERGLRNVSFIGDSTVQQIFFAFMCEIERKALRERDYSDISRNWSWNGEGPNRTDHVKFLGFDVTFKFSPFLRNDLPCFSECVNVSFREAHAGAYGCGGCDPGGTKRKGSFSDSVARVKEEWINDLSDSSQMLFIGTGSWFNYFKGLTNSSQEYGDTLQALKTVLSELKMNRKIDIFWYDIPPCGIFCGDTNPDFEHGGFDSKNALARQSLESVVVYLNTSAAIVKRLNADGLALSAGGPHWCTPGATSIPAFVVSVFLQMASCLLH